MTKRFVLAEDGIKEEEMEDKKESGVKDMDKDSIEAEVEDLKEKAEAALNDLDDNEKKMESNYDVLSGHVARFAEGELKENEADEKAVDAASEIEESVEDGDKASEKLSAYAKHMSEFIIGNKRQLKASTVSELKSIVSTIKDRINSYAKKSYELVSKREAKLGAFKTKKALYYGTFAPTEEKKYPNDYDLDTVMKERQEMIDENKSLYDHPYNRGAKASEAKLFRRRMAEGVTEPSHEMDNAERFPGSSEETQKHTVEDTNVGTAGTGDAAATEFITPSVMKTQLGKQVQENVLAKVAEALDFAAMKQFKGLLTNPLISKIYANMRKAGVNARIASAIIDNAIMARAEESFKIVAEDAVSMIRSFDTNSFLSQREAVSKMQMPSVKNIPVDEKDMEDVEAAHSEEKEEELIPGLAEENITENNIDAMFNKGGNLKMASDNSGMHPYASLRKMPGIR